MEKEEKHVRRRRRKRKRPADKKMRNMGPEKTENVRKKKNRKRGAFDAVSITILIAAVCVFVFSLYQLVLMLVPYYTGSQEYDKIQNLAIEGGDTETGFQVDFDMLLEQNADTVAWIRFDEPSVISYPVVKSKDNNEYLTKTFSANDNKLGTIFVDMRNSSDFSDRNTIIYGHNLRVSGRMFSKLLEYEDESFYKKYPYFYIYTPDGKVRTYTIFSAGVVQDTAENYTLSFDSDEAFEEYLQLCKESSLYDTGVELDAQSKIVSLSTCTNGEETERFLVQGVLTKEE